jgi:hypothetical protein
VVNNGRASNLNLTENAEFYGGIVSGYVTNQGLMCDFDFRGGALIGGILCGYIENSSKVHGIIQDVIFASDTYLSGGELAGRIKGTTASPALLENLFVHPNSKLSDVIIGKNVFFGKNVVLENISFSHQVDYIENVTLQGRIIGNVGQHIVVKNGKLDEDAKLINNIEIAISQ